MASQANLNTISLEAAGDLSASQFSFVDIDANSQVELPSAGGQAVGVLLNKPEAVGEAAEVATVGSVVKVTSAATLTAGDKIATDAAGAATAATSTDTVLAIAIDSAVAGDVFRVLLYAQPVLA